ncbi:CopG family transcriptional regulator [bacterium]|nr:CopG family transcriptional regulator [candidate division CSSED10-310 bacterium]
MDRQNVTVSLPRDLIKRAKHLAVERNTSLSGLLGEYLEKIIRDDEVKRCAAKRIRARLRAPADLGTNGTSVCLREEVHGR